MPFGHGIDYISPGRKSFLVEELPEEGLPIYDRDPYEGYPPGLYRPSVWELLMKDD